MKYLYSQLDKDNFSWFAQDMSVASLTEIDLRRGSLRGLNGFQIKITYPISVIAGKNRSGKSTILAMACCAFHNRKEGFKLPERRLTYYSFSDFFLQTSEEVPLEGIAIFYRIMHNNWKKSKYAPDGSGNLFQSRVKRRGGKWNNYDRRVKRNVVFLGVQRVVPHSEKSISTSYRTYFSDQAPAGWETEVKEVVGRILGASYDSFWMKTYGRYHLPLVANRGNIYSGFNMGAGENALFEIFSIINATPKGTLLVIDEIELGLHEAAQKKLIKELKGVCRERHIQVICTTHSAAIIEAVPPEARFYIENFSGKTSITPGISSAYAAGKLSGEKSNELDIYVEDGKAETIVEPFLSNDVRKRVSIIPIGSPITIIRHMAGRYKEKRKAECICVMDGDQAAKIRHHMKKFLEALENSKDTEKEIEWFEQRLVFLPGKTWPEKWLIQTLRSSTCMLYDMPVVIAGKK
ncbi:MAG: AAA family ATPase [Deltaproteobacteria bacterium]|nr:AAA family ATPase [Deltaproteobacteria bacterium]